MVGVWGWENDNGVGWVDEGREECSEEVYVVFSRQETE